MSTLDVHNENLRFYPNGVAEKPDRPRFKVLTIETPTA